MDLANAGPAHSEARGISVHVWSVLAFTGTWYNHVNFAVEETPVIKLFA
jgi:hypothetical protein